MKRSRAALGGVALGALAWPTVGYPAALLLLGRRRHDARQPRWSVSPPTMTVIVPTYDEAPNIERRLANLLACDYPRERLSVIVVDSASRDGTAAIAEDFADRHPDLEIRVIEETSRNGKAAAINVGIDASDSELVVITDAPTVFEPDALSIVAACFADPDVGAATGYFDVRASGRVSDTEASFWRFRNRLRTLEADVDSTPFLSGELCCFRRSLLREIDVDSLADDMNVALKIRRSGHRVVIDNRARFSEPRSDDATELLTTKSRRAAGGIQELLRARDLTFNPRFGLFGTVILPSAWLYYLPTRVPALGALAWVAAARPLRARRAGALAAAAVVCLSVAPLRRRVVAQATLVAFNEAVLILGWRRVLANEMDVRWTQERSTRVAASAR